MPFGGSGSTCTSLLPMRRITVAVAQTIARPGDILGSIEDHVRLANEAADRGARLVVFPELSLTGYDRRLTAADAVSPDDRRLAPLRGVADRRAVHVVVGAPLVSARGFHIGALCLAPHRAAAVYTKRYLHEGEQVAFVPGDGGDLLEVDGAAVAVAVCADSAHPEHAAEAAARGARVYAASSFMTPAGYAADAARLERYARAHHLAVMMANYGAPVGG